MRQHFFGLAAVLALTVVAEPDDLPPAQQHFAVVHVYARDPSNPSDGPVEQYPERRDWPELILAHLGQPLRIGAVVVAPDLVVTRDHMLDPATIEQIFVETADGRRLPAVLYGRHPRLAALFFKTSEPVLKPLPATTEPTPAERYVAYYMIHVDDYWHLHSTETLREPLWRNNGVAVVGTGLTDSELHLGEALFRNRRPILDGPAAVYTAAGQLLGIGLTSGVHVSAKGQPLDALPVGPVSESEVITPARQKEILAAITDSLARCSVPVTVRFRRPRGAETRPADLEALGLILPNGFVLVPESIAASQVALIDEIVLGEGGNTIQATFVGALLGYRAFLLRVTEEAEGLQPAPLADEKPSMYALLVATDLAWRYGTRLPQTRPVRPYQVRPSLYGGTTYSFAPMVTAGSAVWTLDGKLIGVILREQSRYPGIRSLTANPPLTLGLYLNRYSPDHVFVPAATVLEWLDRVDEVVDLRRRPVPPGEEHRRPWLGVEFARLSKDLADAMNCRRETRDGRIGLLVQFVYPNSPAEAAGIRPGDILLALAVPGYPHLIELTGRRMPTGNVRDVFEQLMRRRMMGAHGRPTGPWPSRQNYLTELLQVLGVGTPVKLLYWRDGKLHVAETTVQLAPPDQDSAPSYKDDQLGLTVKALTYEVRAALQLAEDAPGVVVAEVETGSPAAQARLRPGEIIVTADDKPVRSPEELKALIEAARKSGKASIRFRVMEQGRSRFADVRLQ